MNAWLYRAAGTVGIAGGFLLLAAGSAQAAPASDASHVRAGGIDDLLGEVLSPTAGLRPLDLAAADRPDLSTLRLNPADGRHDQPSAGPPELLPRLRGGVPSLPLGNQRKLSPVPPDAAGIPGGQAGVVLPLDQVLDTDGGPAGPPLDQGPYTLPAPRPPLDGTDPLDPTAAVTGEELPALIAEQVAYDGLYPTDLLAATAPN